MSCLHGRPAVPVDWSSLITLYLSPSRLFLLAPSPIPTFLVVMAQQLYLTHVIAEVYASHIRKIFAPPSVVACKHRDSLVQ